MNALSSIIGMDRHTGRAISGVDHVRQSIADILSTPLGTRICNRRYGSDLPNLVDSAANAAGIQRLYAATARAISIHYPQIRVSNISIDTQIAGSATISITATQNDSPINLSIII